jgi:predicted Zn-dependent peptidase
MTDTLTTQASASIDITLPNGLRFVGERIERSQGVALAVRIPAGVKDDPPNKFGLAGLVKETLVKGTRLHSARKLSDAYDFYGIKHSEQIATENTTLQMRFLPEHTGPALGLLREVLSEPSFPKKKCDVAVIQAVQEIKHLEDEPLSKVFVALKYLHFGAEWGHSELGTEASLPEITRDDIEGFWKAHYIPAGTIVAAAGKFDPDTLAKQLESLFSNSGEAWPRETPPPPPDRPLFKHLFKDSEQTQIALAFPCAPRSDPGYYAARSAIGVLSGGMSSRLFTEVREKRALVYSVGAQAASLRGCGICYAYAGTTAPRAAETLQVLKTELRRLPEDLTQEELDRAKVGFKAHLLMDQESTGARARELLEDVYYENRVVPVAEVVDAINKVTVEEVQRYWRSHPVEPFSLVTLGREAPAGVEVQGA